MWILEKMDVPYIEAEWNVLRDKAFAKDPYKMNGMSVIGKYLSKMKLKQFKEYGFADTERIKAETKAKESEKEEKAQKEKEKYEIILQELLVLNLLHMKRQFDKQKIHFKNKIFSQRVNFWIWVQNLMIRIKFILL